MKHFDPAPVDVPCVDIWPPGRLDDAARYAYDQLAARGRIRLERAYKDPASGRSVVRYQADIPQEWIREELSQIKRTYDGEQLRFPEGGVRNE